MVKSLFDDHIPDRPQESSQSSGIVLPIIDKEDRSLDRLKNLEEKIAGAISKVKALKEEKVLLERRIKELEEQLNEKNQEVERLSSEKFSVKNQVEELLHELESLDLG
jgi:chromosome segregation ATPase